MNDADRAFDLLVRYFTVRSDEGLVEIRRSGDEAVLMFRWRPYPYLFGVPISLTKTDRRLDWDRPAADLDEWVDSVDLWRMETLENGWTLQGRRRQVADYIELRGPAWAYDDRFFVDVVDPTDEHGWLRTDFVSADGIDPSQPLSCEPEPLSPGSPPMRTTPPARRTSARQLSSVSTIGLHGSTASRSSIRRRSRWPSTLCV